MVLSVLIAAAASTLPAKAQTIPNPCLAVEVTTPNGIICILVPSPWNGDLVIFAHGYVDPRQPVGIPYDQLILPDGTSIPGIVTGLHFAFATTSYSKNGLAVKEGVTDILALVQFFKDNVGPVGHVYLIGASEGGLVTTLAVERNPTVFSGGVATCGPIGDFSQQINYWGDFRVLFDYFFPGLLPPTPVTIPDAVYYGWETTYAPLVGGAILDPANLAKTAQLLKVSHAPIDSAKPADTTLQTVLGILGYNVLATNEGKVELGGQPFNNKNPFRFYFGSKNDFLLNLSVARFSADPAALAEIRANYQTSGILRVPLVTLHDTGDPIVPFWHEGLYLLKVLRTGSLRNYVGIPVSRYGHCQFTATEAMVAFYVMVYKATGQLMASSEATALMPGGEEPQQFQQMLDLYINANPSVVYLPVVQ